jgi:hypothetical protein
MAKLWILCDRGHIHVIGNALSGTASICQISRREKGAWFGEFLS